jgi:hypothetical protein
MKRAWKSTVVGIPGTVAGVYGLVVVEVLTAEATGEGFWGCSDCLA